MSMFNPAVEKISLRPESRPFLALSVILLILLTGAACALHPPLLGAAVAALGALGGALFLLRHPQKVLMWSFFLVMVASTKFRARDPNALLAGDMDNQIYFELLLYGLLSLIALINLKSLPGLRRQPTFSEWSLLGYVALAVASSLWSADFRITFARGVQLAVLWTLCFVAVRVLGPERLLRSIAVSCIFYVLLFSLAAYLFPWANRSYLTYTGYPRFSWFAVHPIIAATYAASGLVFLIAEGFFAPGAWRRRLAAIPIWVYVIPLTVILLAIHARGPLFAFVAALLCIGAKRYLNPWIAGIGVYLTLVMLAVPLSYEFSFSRTLERLLSGQGALTDYLLRGQTADKLLHVSGRMELWDALSPLVSQSPIVGYGYSASRKVVLQMIPWAGHAHNALMESLLNLGVIGAILLWLPLLKGLLSGIARSPRNPVLAWHRASILGILFFLTLVSFTDATFAGPPGYAGMLFFAVVFSQDRLRKLDRLGARVS